MSYLTFRNLEKVGRLGNQMWQIASTIGLARRHGMEPRFPPGWSYRQYFSIPGEMFADVQGTESFRLPDLDHMDERTRIYLQDLSFIADVEDEVRSYFRPSVRALEALVPITPSSVRTLVIHVRRGDNVNQQDCYPLPTLAYYLDAADRHRDMDEIAIFGDDFEWNHSVLESRVRALGFLSSGREPWVSTITGVARPKEHEPDYMTAPVLDWIDLFRMAHGSAFCLSNSTMGWWAAWLSGSDDVCYPDPWYGPTLDIHQQGYIDGSLMMPKEWQKVAVSGRREPRRFQYPVGGALS